MNYTYNEPELKIIKQLLSKPPNAIWYNFVDYTFDYGGFYFKLECVSEKADSQNESDEAIIAELTKVNKEYKPTEHSVKVCENKPINEIHIVRGFLYFTPSRNYFVIEKIVKLVRTKLKQFFTQKRDVLGSLLASASSGYEEIVCHPNSRDVKKVNSKYTNLIDYGLLLEIEGKYLRAYITNNGYGFNTWGDKYFFELKDLKKDISTYEFIKVEE